MFSRTKMLLGEDAVNKLKNCRVAVFGAGGVGGYVIEALARSGIGALDIIDNDTVSLSNINRQILATTKTVGMPKTEVAKERVLDINPEINVKVHDVFFMPDTAKCFCFTDYDYIVDAIDTVTGKIELVLKANEANVPIISSMGTGNKLDPTAFRVADISKTSGCALARIMRKECGKRGVKGVKVVFSEELPLEPLEIADESPEPQREGSSRRSLPGSTAFVPGAAGLIMAGEVIKDLSNAE